MDLNELTDRIETVSANYAKIFGFTRDDTWFLLKLQEEVGELTQAHLRISGQARAKGRTQEQIGEDFRSEIADVLCQILLLARHHGIDPVEAIDAKWMKYHPDNPNRRNQAE